MDDELRKYLEAMEQRIKDHITRTLAPIRCQLVTDETRDGIKEPSRSPLEGDAFDFPLEP